MSVSYRQLISTTANYDQTREDLADSKNIVDFDVELDTDEIDVRDQA
jgi:hypothetical protein